LLHFPVEHGANPQIVEDQTLAGHDPGTDGAEGVKAFAASPLSVFALQIAGGGMSIKSGEEVPPGLPVEVSFALLTLPRIWVRGNVTWTKPASKSFGVRFDPHDERRLRIKEWVDSYLES
jgi:hypothetical protein